MLKFIKLKRDKIEKLLNCEIEKLKNCYIEKLRNGFDPKSKREVMKTELQLSTSFPRRRESGDLK